MPAVSSVTRHRYGLELKTTVCVCVVNEDIMSINVNTTGSISYRERKCRDNLKSSCLYEPSAMVTILAY
jgi:hypothetical protein